MCGSKSTADSVAC